MKKAILFLFLSFSMIISAQVTNEGTPESWNLNTIESLESIKMPAFNLQELMEEDALIDHQGKQAWRFGKEFVVNYSLKNSGMWTTLDNGDRIWRIRFQSEDAITMNFIFEDFYLPEGGKIYLYNNEKTALLGAYTHQENNSERMLGTWMIDGDDVWIEYLEPKNVQGKGILQIGKVVHGYRSQSQLLLEFNQKSLNSSGPCNHDVDCPINPDLEDFKNHNKWGVAFLQMGGYICSGSLINNTTNDGTPYFLTADHCYSGNPATWSFRFKWISPNPICAAYQNSTNGPTHFVMSGSQLRARNGQSDFCLVELNNSVPAAWDLVWAGWDRSDNVPSKSWGLHHPSGDIMKVCVDEQSPTKTVSGGAVVWRVNSWELGVTEGGSSGSPLYDNNGRIIGQLYGGTAVCQGLNPVGWDVYGRFATSWNSGSNASSRLREWLDPSNSGVTVLDPFPPMNLSVNDNAFKNSIKIYPNPSQGIFNVSNPLGTGLNYEVYNVLGKLITKGNSTNFNFSLDISGNTSGVYFIKVTDIQTQSSLTEKLILR